MKLFEKMKQVRFARPARPNRRQVKTGAMATVTCVLVVAVVVAANAAFAALPVSLTRADLTSTGLYTLSDTTKTMLSGMEKDVTAYYIAQTGSEDSLVTAMPRPATTSPGSRRTRWKTPPSPTTMMTPPRAAWW